MPRPEDRVYQEGTFKICSKCKGSGSTRHSPQCPKCHGRGQTRV